MRRVAGGIVFRRSRLGLDRAGVSGWPQRRNQSDQAQRDRPDRTLEQLERRQQPDEDLLGIATDDQQRQQVLEHDEEPGRRQQQHARVLHVVHAGKRREDDRGDRDDQAQQQPHRHEKEDRIVEIWPEARRPAVALHGEAQRQPHQRAERGFDGADIGSRERQDDEDRDGHRGPPRSISPRSSPPRRRSRCSRRSMAPPSVSWS